MTFAETSYLRQGPIVECWGHAHGTRKSCLYSLPASASPFLPAFKLAFSDVSVGFQQAPPTHSPRNCCGVEMQVEFLHGRSQFPRSPQAFLLPDSATLTVVQALGTARLFSECSPSPWVCSFVCETIIFSDG